MNPRINELQDYPFTRLRALTADIKPADLNPIPLSLGEPKHAPPSFIVDALAAPEQMAKDLASYPATAGTADFRQAIAD